MIPFQKKENLPEINSWKKELGSILKKLDILNWKTETILINCHQGEIVDVKPTMRIK